MANTPTETPISHITVLSCTPSSRSWVQLPAKTDLRGSRDGSSNWVRPTRVGDLQCVLAPRCIAPQPLWASGNQLAVGSVLFLCFSNKHTQNLSLWHYLWNTPYTYNSFRRQYVEGGIWHSGKNLTWTSSGFHSQLGFQFHFPAKAPQKG